MPSTERPTRRAALAEVKDDLSRFLRLAASEEIGITRHGKPAGILIGFETEDDWFEYRLEHHPEFLRRVAEARASFRSGRGVRLEVAQRMPARMKLWTNWRWKSRKPTRSGAEVIKVAAVMMDQSTP